MGGPAEEEAEIIYYSEVGERKRPLGPPPPPPQPRPAGQHGNEAWTESLMPESLHQMIAGPQVKPCKCELNEAITRTNAHAVCPLTRRTTADLIRTTNNRLCGRSRRLQDKGSPHG